MQTLTLIEEMELDKLVKTSIATRYCEDLERHEDPHGKISTQYVPIDSTQIHALLIDLWGERLTLDEIDRNETELLTDGLGRTEWSQAWCDEEIEEIREQKARDQDYEDQQLYLAFETNEG